MKLQFSFIVVQTRSEGWVVPLDSGSENAFHEMVRCATRKIDSLG